jgi:hypothetical protein
MSTSSPFWNKPKAVCVFAAEGASSAPPVKAYVLVALEV